MAKAGDSITSPVIGDRIVFLQTARDTNGALLQFDDYLQPGGQGPVEHIHPRQEERLAVLAGTAGILIAGGERRLSVGEDLVIAPGTPHRWWNGGTDELQLRTEFRPALDIERFFETLFGLTRDGKTDSAGIPTFLQIVLLSQAYEIFLPKPPIPLQRALFAVLAPIAKLRGYRTWYPQYSSEV